MDLSTAVDATSCEPGSIIYPLCASIYGYAPSLAWNALFLSIFAVSTLAHLAQGVYYRMWTFIIAMCIGGLCEVIGKSLTPQKKKQKKSTNTPHHQVKSAA